jgi:hypothetical protein
MGSELLELTEVQERTTDTLDLPAPTAWPIVLAFGVALLSAGMVTSLSVSILGGILIIGGCVGWFRDVLPRQKMEPVTVLKGVTTVATRHPGVARLGLESALHRARLPLEIYPVSAGVKGGLAGGLAMAVLAAGYGIVSGRGIWYPINLLAAGFFSARDTTEQIAAFHGDSLIVATLIHLVTSLLVGLLYGATLPMFPRRPILLGGIIAPILWSGLLHSVLEFLNPTLNHRIDWPWFVASQMAFGIVAGIVVSKQERVRTWQHLPFAIRAGIEVPGAIGEKNQKDRQP